MYMAKQIFKQNRWLGFALLLVFVLSCENGDGLKHLDKCRYHVNVKARVSQTASNFAEGTKVAVSPENNIIWENSDKLSFMAVTASGSSASAQLEVLSVSDGAATAEFGGSIDMAEEPSECYFVYPCGGGTLESNGADILATFVYDSQTGKHEPFLYGEAAYSVSGINAQLHHFGGVLRIKLPDASTVKKITVMGNGNELLTPYVYSMQPDKSSSASQGADSQFEVMLSASSLEERDGSYYCYISVPPVNFTKGFSLIFSNGTEQMYKSFNYSTSGGCDFSQAPQEGVAVTAQTLKGAIVDIDASNFAGYALVAKLDASHVFAKENGSSQEVLTGTAVQLAEIDMTGYPESLITRWGVELYNGSGEIVRSLDYTNAGGANGTKMSDIGNVTMNIENDWPYLPQGEYIAKPYIETAYGGGKQYGGESVLNVPALEANKLRPSVSAVTSYSYYLAGDLDNANREGTGSSIYNISAGINISDKILQNSKYNATVTVVDNSTSGNLSMNARLSSSEGQILLAQYDVAEWKAYQLASYISFDGVTTPQATTTVHVTGLPYKTIFNNSTSNGWYLYKTDYATNGTLRLAVNKTDSSRGYVVSPKYHVPENIRISYLVKAYYYCSLVGSGSCTIWIEPTSDTATKSQTSAGHLKSSPNLNLPVTYEGDSNSGNCTFTPDKPYMGISHDCTSGTLQTRYVYVRSADLLYSLP